MTGQPTASIETIFGQVMAALCRAVVARSNTRTNWGTPIAPLPGPLILAIWTRLMRVNARFQALAALIRAGALPASRVRRAEAAARENAARRARREAAREARAAGAHPPVTRGGFPLARLPRKFGWIRWTVPCDGGNLAGQIGHLLAKPEMAELIAATPRMGRLLRPLCHMLGIDAAVLIPPRMSPPVSPGMPGPAQSALPGRAGLPQGGSTASEACCAGEVRAGFSPAPAGRAPMGGSLKTA
jgi:hypothetical protein